MALKVLVVEDNDDVRATVVAVLRMAPGITLFEAANGSAAVDIAGRERPQVVVTDIMMPQIDGLEATKRIKLAWPETKVIVVTSARIGQRHLRREQMGLLTRWTWVECCSR